VTDGQTDRPKLMSPAGDSNLDTPNQLLPEYFVPGYADGPVHGLGQLFVEVDGAVCGGFVITLSVDRGLVSLKIETTLLFVLAIRLKPKSKQWTLLMNLLGAYFTNRHNST
jgi:hypothetical protein